jgi:hypothetical protein
MLRGTSLPKEIQTYRLDFINHDFREEERRERLRINPQRCGFVKLKGVKIMG